MKQWYRIGFEIHKISMYEHIIKNGVRCIKAHSKEKAIKKLGEKYNESYDGIFVVKSVYQYPPTYKMDHKKLSKIEKPIKELIGDAS